MTISKSPKRNTFQADGYIKRCEEKGEEPSDDYLEFWKTAKQQDEENMVDPKWQKNNLEYDLRGTDWILEKARSCDNYAQNIYAALCNNEFQKLDVLPILQNQTWSCSWRYAGGIVADMQQKGDYIDWYCSGIGDETPDTGRWVDRPKSYVPEGQITDEIRQDLQKLGWAVVPGGDWEKFDQVDKTK